MGQFILNCDRTKMKAFIVSALLGLAAAAPTPDVGHHSTISVGGVVSHSGHFAPHVGPAVVSHAAPVVAHAVHAPVAHAVHAPVAHAVPAPVVARPVVHAAPVVAHAVHAPVVHRPVVHAAPVVAHAVHAPVVAHAAPAYHAPAPAYADEVSPYTYTYAVADGRIQHVKYSSNAYDGYVADVTYEGTAVY